MMLWRLMCKFLCWHMSHSSSVQEVNHQITRQFYVSCFEKLPNCFLHILVTIVIICLGCVCVCVCVCVCDHPNGCKVVSLVLIFILLMTDIKFLRGLLDICISSLERCNPYENPNSIFLRYKETQSYNLYELRKDPELPNESWKEQSWRYHTSWFQTRI